MYTWGSNDCGQLGIGNTSFQGTPQAVREIREKVTFCSCGPKYTIAVTDTNLVYSFGLNSKGQLGLSQNLQRVRKETEVYVNKLSFFFLKHPLHFTYIFPFFIRSNNYHK